VGSRPFAADVHAVRRVALGALVLLAAIAFAAETPQPLKEALAPYAEFQTYELVAWHKTERQILVRQGDAFYAIGEPGSKPQPVEPQASSYRLDSNAVRYSPDGRGILSIATDVGGTRRLMWTATGRGKPRVLTPKIDHDVEAFAVSYETNRIAFVTDEDGSSVLRFMDLATLKELPRPSLVRGVIASLKWRPGAREVAFTMTSSRVASDVFSYDVDSNKLARWTNGNSPRVNVSAFVEPSLLHWKAADGHIIAAYLYQPPERFTGPRPVLLSLPPGGAEARPGFIGRDNHLVDELGIAILQPTLRKAPEERQRDLDALREWIGTRPELDASRVLVQDSNSDAAFQAAAAFASEGS
jgi:hypothetical protein